VTHSISHGVSAFAQVGLRGDTTWSPWTSQRNVSEDLHREFAIEFLDASENIRSRPRTKAFVPVSISKNPASDDCLKIPSVDHEILAEIAAFDSSIKHLSSPAFGAFSTGKDPNKMTFY
jgi:hypothetical protein